ncbi:MAG: hypothetical protein V3V78_04295 [Candidatus Woesearchaeota archaeon]
MADVLIWAVLATIIALGIVAGIVAYQRKKSGKKHEVDYKAFFIMGVAFLAIGIIDRDSSFFFIMGLVFIALGLMNKDKWKKYKPWNKLNKQEKKEKLILIISGLVLLVVGIIIFLITYFRVKP